jgi:hypothetical protein
MELTLYRAANTTDLEGGTASFSEDLATARAYLDNPSFGGSTMYRVTVEIVDGEMLDLVDGDMPEWLEERISRLGAAEMAWAITAPSTGIYRMLLARGIRWVRFTDDYPEGAVTVCRVVDNDEGDYEIEQAMVVC